MSRTIDYFVSDLHLGAAYIADPRRHERMVCDWLRSIEPTARRLFLVGDILDYWFEYRSVVPQGYVRFFGALAQLADSGVEITWLIGNHDIWIFDYLPSELGIRVADGVIRTEIDGKKFVIAHGDGLGHVPLKERIMRTIFRSRLCQRAFAAIHPRWTVGLAHSWSASNRRRHSAPASTPLSLKPIEDWVAREQETSKADFYVFGHYHTLYNTEIDGAEMVILGDWISNMSYATFDGSSITLHRYQSQTNP